MKRLLLIIGLLSINTVSPFGDMQRTIARVTWYANYKNQPAQTQFDNFKKNIDNYYDILKKKIYELKDDRANGNPDAAAILTDWKKWAQILKDQSPSENRQNISDLLNQ